MMLRKILIGLLSLPLVVIGLVVLALLFVNIPPGKKLLSDIASDQLGRPVTYYGHLYPLLRWPLTVRLEGLDVANTEGMQHDTMADIGRLEVSVALAPLLRGETVLPRIMLADSEVHLEKPAKGKANWEFAEDDEPAPATPEGESTPPTIGMLELYDAELTYRDVPENIDLSLKGNSDNTDTRVTGGGTYHGQKFTLDATTGALLSMQKDSTYPVDLTVKAGNTRLDAKGSLKAEGKLDDMDMNLRIQGADASELFPLIGVVLLPTPPYDVKGDLNYQNGVWQFNKFTGKLGSSDLSGDLAWDTTRERPKLSGKFVSKRLDFADLGPLIGKSPEDAESAKQQADKAKEAESPYVIPDVPLNLDRLDAMDADVTFTGRQIISPSLPLDDFLLHLILDNKILKITPVQFGTANGEIVLNGTINARTLPPQSDIDLRIKRLSLAEMTKPIQKTLPQSKGSEGFIDGSATLKASGESLKKILATANGNIGIGMEDGKLSNLVTELIGLDVAQGIGFLISGDVVVPIRCIIADFAVDDGLMTSRTVTLDTTDTNIIAKGTINLQSEKMDLRITPQPKDTTPASLRSPILVGGTFKSPDIAIDPSYLAVRSAIGVVLGVVLTPVAGALALVEPGTGKDSNCKALYAKLRAGEPTAPRDKLDTVADDTPANSPAAKEKSDNLEKAEPATRKTSGSTLAPAAGAKDRAIRPLYDAINNKPGTR